MMQQLKQKYGLFTAIAMVVGIVIGSGVFFKAEKVLSATNGNLPLGIGAWVLGGLIVLVCAYTFSILATRYVKVNGIVDYAENAVGNRYAYFMGWFMAFIYYPSLTSVLAWVSARYTGVLFNVSIAGPEVMVIAFVYMVVFYALNTLSPVIAGKFQVSTTVIKLIPLLLVAVVGLIAGLSNGLTIENFSTANIIPEGGYGVALFTAVAACAFAYDGWIIATSINAELKNPKRNLPIALSLGMVAVIVVYILYYIGLSGGATNADLIAQGEAGVKMAFSNIFGSVGGSALSVVVVISCLGTLNGLMVATTRSIYALSARKTGPKPELFGKLDEHTNIPTNSSIVGLLMAAVWLFFFYGSVVMTIEGKAPLFGKMSFDSSELSIVSIYALYIPIFFMMMKREKDLHPVKRFLVPALSILGCLFMVVALIVSHGWTPTIAFLIIAGVIMLASIPFYKKKQQ
ncbi:MAG: APC family permease [Clostridia bacterium]|nr:APC family permease [Clostridia bacterium]